MPPEFPPWQNVYRTFRPWAAGGKFEQMHDRLRAPWRSRKERAPEPTAAVLDAQSTAVRRSAVRATTMRARRSKGVIAICWSRPQGLLLAVSVTRADLQDRDGATTVIREALDKYPSLEKLYVDGGTLARAPRPSGTSTKVTWW